MIALALNNIKKFYGANQVLENISFDIQEGEKIGIVGRNGCGKSTVLKLILGFEGEYTGSINIKKGSNLGYVDQLPTYDDATKVLDVLNTAFESQHKLQQKMNELEAVMSNVSGLELDRILNSYTMLQKNFEQLGGYELEEKLSKVCSGLDISENFRLRTFNTLSGGEKTTVLLSKLLLQSPDILLLDEPSNHLDLKSIEWLEDFLNGYKGTVVIVSHDRYFLDRTVTKVIEIENMISKTYLGNYSDFVVQKERDLFFQAEAFNNQQKKIKGIENSIKTLRDWGNRSGNEKFYKRSASMQKRLDKIERIDKPNPDDESMNMNFSLGNRSGKDVIKLIDGNKKFKDKVILNNANLHIRFGEKSALIGNNGCGKTTLLKMIVNTLDPMDELSHYILDSGSLETGAALKVGYLSQNIVFPDEAHTILECFRDDIQITEGKGREYLAKFLFYGESVFKKIKNLSGGERSRLMLAKLMFNEVNLLILDEPTNHLDIASREALEENLLDFPGSILFVSHDRYFINVLCSRIIELNNGTLIPYKGDYEYYKLKKEVENIPTKPVEKQSVKKVEKSLKAKRTVPNASTSIEDKIRDLEEQMGAIDYKMSLSDDYKYINELYNKKQAIAEEIEILMTEWIDFFG